MATSLCGQFAFAASASNVAGGLRAADCYGRSKSCGRLPPHGMSVRFYDPQIDAWRSTWHGPVNRVVIPFIARQVDDDMILKRTEGVETTRWIFTETTANSFRWINMISLDDRRSWTLRQEMRAVRRLEAEAAGSRGRKSPTAKGEQ